MIRTPYGVDAHIMAQEGVRTGRGAYGLTIAIGVLLSLPGLLLVSASLVPIVLARQSRHWPKVQGTVLNFQPMKVSEHQWVPGVTYQYTVADRTYKGNRVSFGKQMIATRQNVEALATATFPPGATIPVHYHPHKPDCSVLYPEGNFVVILNYFVPGVLLVLIGLPLSAVGLIGVLRRRT